MTKFFHNLRVMKHLSVNKAITVAWVIISAMAMLMLTMMFTIMVLTEFCNWPLYVGIPAAFILPIAVMCICFPYAGKNWVAWSYTNVTDVVELSKAWQISGFGAYSVDDIKDEQKRTLVQERFANYQFQDDAALPYQTCIYFRKPYQNLFFLIMFGFFIFTLIPFFMFPSNIAQLTIPAFFGVAAFITYYRSSDRSPQMILSETSFDVKGKLYEWAEISDYEIWQGKTSYLYYTHNGIKDKIELDNLMVSNRRLNHLVHVYSSRSKRSAKLAPPNQVVRGKITADKLNSAL